MNANDNRRADLYQHLFRKVVTSLGSGILEQVFSDRVCVRIDRKPRRADKPTETLYYFSPDDAQICGEHPQERQ
jgi:hypothetical protein